MADTYFIEHETLEESERKREKMFEISISSCATEKFRGIFTTVLPIIIISIVNNKTDIILLHNSIDVIIIFIIIFDIMNIIVIAINTRCSDNSSSGSIRSSFCNLFNISVNKTT